MDKKCFFVYLMVKNKNNIVLIFCVMNQSIVSVLQLSDKQSFVCLFCDKLA